MHPVLRRLRIAAVVAPLLAAAAWRPPASAAPYVVIVNASNKVESTNKNDLARIFFKKTRAWPGGVAADPVDLKDGSAARTAFLSAVMQKDAGAMHAYWQSQVFVGRTTPPPVKASDAEVVAYVAGSPGGVGYVAAGTTLPETVKVLKVE